MPNKVKVRTAGDGAEFELDRDVVRHAGFLMRLLEDRDSVEQTLPIDHEKATRAIVERCAEYATLPPRTLPPQKEKDVDICAALVVANYLELQPAIENLCRWMARGVNQCPSPAAIRTRLQMGERPDLQEEIQAAGCGAAEVHETGILGCLPTSFWNEHLLPILSDPTRESLYLACAQFSPLSSCPSLQKLVTFRHSTSRDILKQLRDLEKHIELDACKELEIARRFVAAYRSESGYQPLNVIFGTVLVLEDEFDYQRSHDEMREEYFNVVSMICDAGQDAMEHFDTESEQMLAQVEESAQVQEMQARVKTLLRQARAYIQEQIKATKTRRERANTLILKSLPIPGTDASPEELDAIFESFEAGGEPLTRSIKRAKTRGPRGGEQGRQRSKEAQRLQVQRDLRTLPAGCPWSLGIRVARAGEAPWSGSISSPRDVFRYERSGHASLECVYELPEDAAATKIRLWNAGCDPIQMRISSSSSSSSSIEDSATVETIETGAEKSIQHEGGEGGDWAFADADGVTWLRVCLVKAA